MNTKVENKVMILSDTLAEFFGDNMNLARIKFFGLFISALCRVQTVCFEKLAGCFESDAKMDSSLRRIQRFMSEYVLDTNLVARFVFALLPHKPPYRLVLDRTNWKFGTKDINILTLGIVCKGVAFPHLTDIERIRKLMALVLVAFAWVYKAGIYLNGLCPIKTKNHGRKVKSLFKYGLNYIANLLFNNDIENFTQCCKFLSCT